MLGYRLAYTLDCIMSYTYSITHWVTYCRSATLSDFPHLHELGHSMSALCTISCLLSDQGLKIPKSDLFVYELKPVSMYRCTPAVISPSLDLLFIRISQNIARGYSRSNSLVIRDIRLSPLWIFIIRTQ